MRRTWIVLAVVLLAVLLVAMPGLAAAKGGQGSASFNLRGFIKDYNCSEGWIEVTVDYPESLPDTTTVQITGDTRFKECDDGTAERIYCGDLEEDWDVKIAGTVVGDTYFANSVIQYVPPEE